MVIQKDIVRRDTIVVGSRTRKTRLGHAMVSDWQVTMGIRLAVTLFNAHESRLC